MLFFTSFLNVMTLNEVSQNVSLAKIAWASIAIGPFFCNTNMSRRNNIFKKNDHTVTDTPELCEIFKFGTFQNFFTLSCNILLLKAQLTDSVNMTDNSSALCFPILVGILSKSMV